MSSIEENTYKTTQLPARTSVTHKNVKFQVEIWWKEDIEIPRFLLRNFAVGKPCSGAHWVASLARLMLAPQTLGSSVLSPSQSIHLMRQRIAKVPCCGHLLHFVCSFLPNRRVHFNSIFLVTQPNSKVKFHTLFHRRPVQCWRTQITFILILYLINTFINENLSFFPQNFVRFMSNLFTKCLLY